jgi:signal transduction histidine kinase/ligand-binding sensor domain-containing protein
MNKRVIVLLILFIAAFASNSYSQLQRRYTTYNVENGLAQNSVWNVFQDYRGFLWLGTADGINRFDGYEMHHYKRNLNDSTSIYGITFFEFFELPNKELWISHDKGISVFNRIKNNFNNLIKSENTHQIIGYDDNYIFIFEERMKILIIDINTKKVVKTISEKFLNDYSRHTTSNTIKIKNNFFTTFNGNHILKIDCKKYKVELIDFKEIRPEIFRFVKTSDSTFIGFSSAELKMFTFKYAEQKFSYTTQNVNNYKPFKRSTGIYEWGDKLYATSLEGFYIINKDTYNVEEYVENFSTYENSFNYIQHLGKDQSNNLYISTNGMGIKTFSPYLNKFPHYRTPNERTNMVKSVLSTKDGKIITGVYNEGLVIYYPNNTFKQFMFEPAHEKNNSFRSVLGMTNYSDKEILVMFSDRLLLFNHYTNKHTYIKNTSNLEFQFYPSILKHNNKFYYFNNDSTNSKFIELQDNLEPKQLFKLNSTNVTTFVFHKNKIMIGTDRGLILKENYTSKVIYTKIKLMVKSICITSKNKIFLTTINGLYEIDENATILKKYDVRSGLPDDFIYGVLEDKNGDLWMSHNKGISVLNLKTNKFKNYSVKDGLQSNEFNTGAYYKDENGLMYFGGVNGINCIDPDKIIQNKNAPKIAINQINLSDEPYQSDTSYNELTQLNFEYNQNTLSFDFSALEFTNPAFNTYKYILSGYDKQWIQSGTKHFARYSNLPPGKYAFMIMAANADGAWSQEPKVLVINIKAPFWQSNWFYTIVGITILLFIGLIIYTIIYRQKLKLNRQLKLQFELEQERLRIARDLHDNVGAHLSYLISNLDWMISHPEKLSIEEEKKRLENLTETGRQAILTLRQTIWAINNQALYIEDFADKYKTFAKKMLDFSEHIQIHFDEDIKGKQKLSPGITLHLFRICQEALSNILKHAKATNIYVCFKSNDEFLFYFNIKDDGKGFDTSVDYSNNHFGLVIMKERAEECGAKFSIKSSIGEGTEVNLSINK